MAEGDRTVWDARQGRNTLAREFARLLRAYTAEYGVIVTSVYVDALNDGQAGIAYAVEVEAALLKY